jgi:hypothetical protein
MAAITGDLMTLMATSCLDHASGIKAQAIILATDTANQVIATMADVATTNDEMVLTFTMLVWCACALWVLCKMAKWARLVCYSCIAIHACAKIVPAVLAMYATYDQAMLCMHVLAGSVCALWCAAQLRSICKQVSAPHCDSSSSLWLGVSAVPQHWCWYAAKPLLKVMLSSLLYSLL